MSRRASLFSKENPEKRKPKVSFPDELVFLDNIKENDVPAMQSMLRRVSVQIDLNAIGNSGMTPLHQAVMEDNLAAVQLLIRTGADINRQDEDTWTPLHAACANGFSDIVRFLLESGADRSILTDEGERAYDLIEPDDMATVGVMLSNCTMREDSEEEEQGSDREEGCHSDQEGCHSDQEGCHSDQEGCHSDHENCNSDQEGCHNGRDSYHGDDDNDCHSDQNGCHGEVDGCCGHTQGYHGDDNKDDTAENGDSVKFSVSDKDKSSSTSKNFAIKSCLKKPKNCSNEFSNHSDKVTTDTKQCRLMGDG